MKKLKVLACSLSLLFAFTGTLFVASTVTGCKTSQATIAYKTIASLQASVSAALEGWADYVVLRRNQIAKLEPGEEKESAASTLAKRETQVRVLLDRYKMAAAAARIGVNAGLKDDVLPATGELLSAGNDLIFAASTPTR